ncbi:hypothetical protein [Aliiroseovarius sp. F47248L]|uniref:hypothetical protein n=1 Tax=Aliiroseovarius sp. F47248L TaxID=2926420 RepID=UPI001FF24A68|nr:hypothetical protein [Aliiroseovarius sp. F47248L]MCK0138935.1 hypothetical protein [Aliiroseovarius sp. F47248L]
MFEKTATLIFSVVAGSCFQTPAFADIAVEFLYHNSTTTRSATKPKIGQLLYSTPFPTMDHPASYLIPGNLAEHLFLLPTAMERSPLQSPDFLEVFHQPYFQVVPRSAIDETPLDTFDWNLSTEDTQNSWLENEPTISESQRTSKYHLLDEILGWEKIRNAFDAPRFTRARSSREIFCSANLRKRYPRLSLISNVADDFFTTSNWADDGFNSWAAALVDHEASIWIALDSEDLPFSSLASLQRKQFEASDPFEEFLIRNCLISHLKEIWKGTPTVTDSKLFSTPAIVPWVMMFEWYDHSAGKFLIRSGTKPEELEMTIENVDTILSYLEILEDSEIRDALDRSFLKFLSAVYDTPEDVSVRTLANELSSLRTKLMARKLSLNMISELLYSISRLDNDRSPSVANYGTNTSDKNGIIEQYVLEQISAFKIRYGGVGKVANEIKSAFPTADQKFLDSIALSMQFELDSRVELFSQFAKCLYWELFPVKPFDIELYHSALQRVNFFENPSPNPRRRWSDLVQPISSNRFVVDFDRPLLSYSTRRFPGYRRNRDSGLCGVIANRKLPTRNFPEIFDLANLMHDQKWLDTKQRDFVRNTFLQLDLVSLTPPPNANLLPRLTIDREWEIQSQRQIAQVLDRSSREVSSRLRSVIAEYDKELGLETNNVPVEAYTLWNAGNSGANVKNFFANETLHGAFAADFFVTLQGAKNSGMPRSNHFQAIVWFETASSGKRCLYFDQDKKRIALGVQGTSENCITFQVSRDVNRVGLLRVNATLALNSALFLILDDAIVDPVETWLFAERNLVPRRVYRRVLDPVQPVMRGFYTALKDETFVLEVLR